MAYISACDTEDACLHSSINVKKQIIVNPSKASTLVFKYSSASASDTNVQVNDRGLVKHTKRTPKLSLFINI